MTALTDIRETEASHSAEREIHDRGGSRSGRERRRNSTTCEGAERQAGRDRRSGFDRRSGIERRRSDDRRPDGALGELELIERRDAFRRPVKGK
jgi:hypothetical protein